MPRRRTLTGRVERNLNTRAVRATRQSDSSQLTNGIQLQDANRCALNPVPSDFLSFTLGEMNCDCLLCGAIHFQSEITMRQSNVFTLCCHKGKVVLPPLTSNQYFKTLCEGITSRHRLTRQRSQNYLNNIRSFNAAFAMVSSEAEIDDSDIAMNGIYHFKIHDVFYHRAGPLTNAIDRQPTYAQLYFYDVETAVQYRMLQRANESCNVNLMREIAGQLERVNNFIHSFKTMSTYCQQPENAAAEVSLLIKVNNNIDLRRFNDAIMTDVAVIFKTTDGQPPFERNMVIFSKSSGTTRCISVLDSSLDPLAYPLLFPNGDTGWHADMWHNIASTSNSRVHREKITMLQYASYRLAIRSGFSILHNSQKLFLQWVVDMYVRIEGARLNYMRLNQSDFRSEVYNNLVDYLAIRRDGVEQRVGRRVILPTSFIGSPRSMHQNYLDAMSIVQHFGKPSLFITMTCNPNWPEIQNNLPLSRASNFRPDLVVRVFKHKLNELVASIIKKNIFGKVEALIYTIEFQKRGLPHAHILLTMKHDDRIDGVVKIDKTVSAEIPDSETNAKLHQLVVNHMIHGPCGALNPNSVCMKDGQCTKKFPKDFTENTIENMNGFPAYKRRDNGVTVVVRQREVDNRFVVPYNPYLLAKFDCHLNVEVCSSVKSVKYIYKYVYKGYDCASVEIGAVTTDENGNLQIDEIKNYLSGRYVGSTEAAWRIFEYPMHYQTHTIIRLECHLPGQQNVVFREGREEQSTSANRFTKLTAFMELNRIDSSANQYTYTQIPLHYVWIVSEKKWRKRQRGDKIISRLYVISPRNIELFHLRLLLLHVRGPKNFEDLRTYEGILYPTFVAACHARGIASNDTEWQACINEAKDTQSPQKLRELFGFICGMNAPSNALALWNEFKLYMCEDFLRNHTEEIAINRALSIIEDILSSHSMSCQDLGLPAPRNIQSDTAQNFFSIEEEVSIFETMYGNANEGQKSIIDKVMEEVLYHNTGSNVFCLTAHAGCGKTFVQTALIHKMNSLNLRCIPCAFSGIASTLLIGGRTLHNVFKLPINLLDNSVSSIKANSSHAQHLKSAALIITSRPSPRNSRANLSINKRRRI